MDEMTTEMIRFADLRPSEPTLTAHDLAELRGELFPGAAPPAAPPREARVIELGDRPELSGNRRWLAAAAAAVVVLGGAGVWMAADRDAGPSETTPASQPEASEPPTSGTVARPARAVPRVALTEPGWTLTRAYEDGSDTARSVVFLSADELDGPWVEVSVVGATSAGSLPTIPLGEVDGGVSEFGVGTLVYWTTPSGVSLQAYGWGLDAAALAPIVAEVSVTDEAITFGDLPDGATVADSGLTDALGRYAEYGFTHEDGRELQVSFYAGGPRAQYSRIDDEGRSDVTVGDERGSLLTYGDGRYRVNLERGFWAWEFNGEPFTSEQAFLDTAAGVTVVDEATWQANLPDGIVGSADVADQTAADLADVPLPNGLDPASIAPAATLDRYQFVADLSMGVVCGWLDQWFTGVEAGDDALRTQAADALATSHDWSMLIEIADQGGWSDVVWFHADAVNGELPDAWEPTRADAESAFGCAF